MQLQIHHNGMIVNRLTEVKFEPGIKIIDLSIRSMHCIALDNNILYLWGRNDGCINPGESFVVESLFREPVTMTFFNDRNLIIKEMSTGDLSCMILTESGRLFVWGYDIGNGFRYKQPTELEGLKNKKIKHIATGENHSMVVTEDNKIYG